MTEKEDAVFLANKILDRQYGDPDDDLGVLARQLLRREERLQRIVLVAKGIGDSESLLRHIAKIAQGEAL